MKLASVLEIVRACAGCRDRMTLLPTFTNALRQLVRADWYLIVLRRGRDADLLDVYSEPEMDVLSHRAEDYQRIDTMETTRRAFRLYREELASHPLNLALLERYGIRTVIRIPMFVEDKLVGGIVLWSRDRQAFDAVDLDVLTDVGKAVAVLFDSCLAYEHLAHLRDDLREDNASLRDELAHASQAASGIVGHGPAVMTIKSQIEMVAPTETTVLLTGESGTGKDVVAHAIHRASTRQLRPLVTVNCAAIPSSLAEAELFGHEEGAFTGASKPRAGRFEQADGGTLFLDEIGELPLEVQAKLLRVLQEREVERVGGGEPIKVDVRIIAATNRDLQEMIREDRFREDLYFRLAVFPIHLAPLRSRLEDLPELVEHFVRISAERFRVPPRKVTSEVIRRLADHDWPGNVRELQHAIERAMIVSSGDVLSVDTIVPRKIAPISTGAASDELRAEYMRALEQAAWVIEGPDGAAAQLGVHPNTLRHRLKRMGIVRPTTAR